MSGAAFLAVGLALPLLVALALLSFVRRRRRVAGQLGDPRLLAALSGEDLLAVPWASVVPVLLAAVALGAALADPRWGEGGEEATTRGGRVVLVLDASGSMLASDLAPSRLEWMREASRSLVEALPEAAVAVVVFAGRAYALVPPTVDRGALDLYLSALDPAMVTQSGSSLSAAVRQGVGLLAAGEGDLSTGSLVLVSDGDALEEEAAVREAAALARRAGVPIHALGAGTAEGAPVPDVDLATGEAVGFVRDPGGAIAVSRLNEELLREIAGETGGEYAPLSDPGAVERLAETLREREGEGRGRKGAPRYAWFAFAAFLLLLLEGGRGFRPGALPLLLLLAGCGGEEPPAPPPGEDAAAALHFQALLEEDPDDPLLRYDLGTALLRLGRYEAARPHLSAASRTGTPEVRPPAYYNLGGADLEPAFAGRTEGDRREALVRAIVAYKRALLLDPTDGEAKWNLELARRLLRQEPPPPSPGGGGGAGGGGGGGGEEDPGRRDRSPNPSGGTGPLPPLSPAAAERLLAAAEEREVGLQREVLRKPQPRTGRAH